MGKPKGVKENVVTINTTIPTRLLERLDIMIKEGFWKSRAEFFCFALRQEFFEEEKKARQVLGRK